MKKITDKWWFWVIIIVLVLVFYGIGVLITQKNIDKELENTTELINYMTKQYGKIN